jgi:hypothetical protein
MRKSHFSVFLRTLAPLIAGLFAILVAACVPSETSIPAPESAALTPIILAVTATPVVGLTTNPGDTDSPNSATPAPIATAQAVATSRGPNLEATDPTTVSLASGGVQFVEFFRFT